MSRSFLERVAERYGNPNAQFADSSPLKRGQHVRVILNGELRRTCVADAKVIKPGKVLVDYNGKRWECSIPKNRILVRW